MYLAKIVPVQAVEACWFQQRSKHLVFDICRDSWKLYTWRWICKKHVKSIGGTTIFAKDFATSKLPRASSDKLCLLAVAKEETVNAFRKITGTFGQPEHILHFEGYVKTDSWDAESGCHSIGIQHNI